MKKLLLFLALFLGMSTSADAATPSSTFVDKIGVNVHTAYLTSQHPQYGYGDRIALALETVGIKHIRDGMTKASPPPHFHWTKLQYVADRVGGDITLIVDSKSWFTGVDEALANIKTYMPNTAIIEGENEADNPGVGGTGLANATARQNLIYSHVRADPWFDGKPVLAPSFITAASYQTVQQADASSCHPYPGGNFDTVERITSAMNVCQPQTPGKPIYNTEYGFPLTAPNPCTGQRGMTDTEASTWVMSSILSSIQTGSPRLYWYELFDSNSCNWGLFDRNGTIKPYGQTLANWNALLTDTNSPTKADTSLTVTDPAGAGTLRTMQFAKADGSFWVALWPTRLGAGSRTVTLKRPTGTTYSWQRHEPWVDTSAHNYTLNVDTYQVPITGDNPLLVRVRPR